MSCLGRLAAWPIVLVLGLAAPAGAQVAAPAPTSVLGPQELKPSRPAPLVFTPTLTVFEEYNDNVFLASRARHADWITGLAPGLMLTGAGERYRLGAAYNFVAETYAREPRLDDGFARQNLALDALYRAGPRVTLTLTEAFIAGRDTNLLSPSGIATGRTRAWSNTVTPGVAWELDPVWTLRASATYVAERFDRRALADSDVYRLDGGVERRLTPRLTGTAGYEVGLFDVAREREVLTHTPRLGAAYRFTPTLHGAVSAGPTVEVGQDGRARVTPAVRASLGQDFRSGSARLEYERTVGTADGLGGTTRNDILGARLRANDLVRGLVLELMPRYTHAGSTDGRIDAHAWSVALRSVYRVTTWLSLYLGYTFFEQRSRTTLAGDADQNRVSFGVQVGYPLTLD